jgi:hypothetical protein
MSTSIKAGSATPEILQALAEAQIDVTGAVEVGIIIDDAPAEPITNLNDIHKTQWVNRRVWINVNGICVLRVCLADKITVDNIARQRGQPLGKPGSAKR